MRIYRYGRATSVSVIAGLLLGSLTAIVGGVVSPASATSTVGCDDSPTSKSTFSSITAANAWVSGTVESGTVRVQADHDNSLDITHQGTTPSGPEDMVGAAGAGISSSDSATIQYFTPGGTSATCYVSFRMRLRLAAGSDSSGPIAKYQYRIAVGNASSGLIGWFTLNGGGSGGASTVEIWNPGYTVDTVTSTIPKTDNGSDDGMAWAPATLNDGSYWVYWKAPLATVNAFLPSALTRPVGIAAGTATSNSTSFNKDCMDGFPAHGKAGSSSNIDACTPNAALFSVIPAVDLTQPSNKLNLVINTASTAGVFGTYAGSFSDTKTISTTIDTVTVTPNLAVDSWTVTTASLYDSTTVTFDSHTGTAIDSYWRASGTTGTDAHAASTYTITAYKGSDSATVTYNLTVLASAEPLNLRLNGGVTSLIETQTVGQVINGADPYSITSTNADTYTVSCSPALPTGVAADNTTGMIDGTPSTTTSGSVCTITGYKGSESSTVTYTLVVVPAHMTLDPYSSSNDSNVWEETITLGESLDTVTITPGVSAPSTLAFSPAIAPGGVSFDTTTSQIYGTPTAPQLRAAYAITATGNHGETTTGTFYLTVRLKVTVTIVGSGSVSGAGSTRYDTGTTATLAASPASDWVFSGWSGDCSGTSASQSLTMTANKACTATFTYSPPAPNTFHLTVTIVGSGSVAPGDGEYVEGSVVSPQATPATGYRFAGWGGACSGTTCSVAMTTNKAVTATFVLAYPVTVTPAGSGHATITPASTDGSYTKDSTVTITATPDPGWYFTGWSGDCSGTANPLTLTVDAAKNCTANFVKGNALDATVDGQGAVSRDIDPTAGVYKPGTVVTLTATPAAGWVFTGWSGDCTGTTNPLQVTLDKAKTCKATFSNKVPLETKVTGNGTITPSTPIDQPLTLGTAVTLTAKPGPMQVFVGWSGSCTGTTNPITVTVDAAKSCTANFVTLMPVPAGTYAPVSASKSTIQWEAADNATSYDITVEGKVVCTTSELTCDVAQLLGPKSKVFAIATNGDLRATPTRLKYQASGPVRVFRVHFPESSYVLTPTAKAILTDIAKKMVALGFTSLKVAGYTDAQGGAKGASTLSSNRANAVVKFLSQYIKVIPVANGYGNTNFVADNTTEAGRAANRRADGWVQ